MSYIKEDKVLIPTSEGYISEIPVLDNGDNGFFFVGTVQTPAFMIGKKVILTIKIEDQ